MPFYLSQNKTLEVPCHSLHEVEEFCKGKPESELYWYYAPGLGEPMCPKDRGNALRWNRIKRGRANLVTFYAYLIKAGSSWGSILPVVDRGPVMIAPGILMDHAYNPVLNLRVLK